MDLRDRVLRVVDERLKRACHARHFYQVAGRPRRDGLQQCLHGEDADEGDKGVGEEGGPRRRRGAVARAEEANRGLDEFGALLDLGADREANVYSNRSASCQKLELLCRMGVYLQLSDGTSRCGVGRTSIESNGSTLIVLSCTSGLGLRRFSGLWLPGGNLVCIALCSTLPPPKTLPSLRSSSISDSGDAPRAEGRGGIAARTSSRGPLQKPLLRSPLPSLRHAGGE